MRFRKKVIALLSMILALIGLTCGSNQSFAGKVIVDPANPVQDVKNNFLIPKEVSNAKANITVDNASKTYKYYVGKNQGDYSGDFVGLVEGNKNIRYASFQKNYGQTNLVLEGVNPNTRVNIDYGQIGIYNKQKVNVKLVLSDIKMYTDDLPFNLMNNDYTKTHFRDDGYLNANGAMSKSKKRTVFWISDNLFSGIVYHSTQMNVQLVVTYPNGSPVNFAGDTFISFNSLNPAAGSSTRLKGEYAFYNKMTTNDWYVRNDTVLAEFKSFYNNLNVIGGKDGGNSKLTNAHHVFNNSHDKLGDPKFGQGTVSFRVSEANPLFVIGSSNVQTWFSLSSATIFSVVPDKPIKTGENNQGANIDGKIVNVGDEITYKVKQDVGTLGEDQLAVYDKFQLIDYLPPEVDYLSAQVVTGGTRFDTAGEIVYDQAKHTVTYTANANTLKNRMKYAAERYELQIKTKVNSKATTGAEIRNKAKSIINKVEENTNEIVNYPKVDPEIKKKIIQGGKEVDSAEVNYDDPFTYKAYYTFPNPSDDANFIITDDLENILDLDETSIKVFNEAGTDITSTGNLQIDQQNEKWTWTIANNAQTRGRKGFVTFNAKVKLDHPDADKYLDANGNISIPNVIKLNVLTSNEVKVIPKIPTMNVTTPRTGSKHVQSLMVISSAILILLVLIVFVYKKRKFRRG